MPTNLRELKLKGLNQGKPCVKAFCYFITAVSSYSSLFGLTLGIKLNARCVDDIHHRNIENKY